MLELHFKIVHELSVVLHDRVHLGTGVVHQPLPQGQVRHGATDDPFAIIEIVALEQRAYVFGKNQPIPIHGVHEFVIGYGLSLQPSFHFHPAVASPFQIDDHRFEFERGGNRSVYYRANPLLRPACPAAALGVGATPLSQPLFFGFVVLHNVNQRIHFGSRRNLDAAPAHRFRQSRDSVVNANHARHQHLHGGDARRLRPVRGIQPVLRRPHFGVQLLMVEPAQVPNATLSPLHLIEAGNARLDPALVVVARKRHVRGNDERGVRHRRNNVGPQVQNSA